MVWKLNNIIRTHTHFLVPAQGVRERNCHSTLTSLSTRCMQRAKRWESVGFWWRHDNINFPSWVPNPKKEHESDTHTKNLSANKPPSHPTLRPKYCNLWLNTIHQLQIQYMSKGSRGNFTGFACWANVVFWERICLVKHDASVAGWTRGGISSKATWLPLHATERRCDAMQRRKLRSLFNQ